MYKKFTLLAVAVLFISLLPATLKAASEWENAVTIYGAALENDDGLREDTSSLLGTEDGDETGYVYSEDLQNYLDVYYDDSVLKSSIRIIQRDPGHGLNITLNEEMGEITQITEETYQNALITSGVTDADVTIAAAEDVTGESALSGIYKAYEVQGEEIPEERTRNAQEELEAITDIAEENSGVEGFSQVQLNKMITEIKIEIVNNYGGDVTEEDVRGIVDEKMQENGLDGILSQEQIDRIVGILLDIRDSGIFSGEEAERLMESSRDLVDQITSSDAFGEARDRAGEIGQEIQESGAWQSFVDALRNFFSRVADFVRNLF
ncbi:DUF1002 domain-containing protein [Salinicoccus halitifaciens]|uniref:Uncharacterized protein YpuA (DUF1002 family) n=1 Tax=Salinicoccus halitifaciens TaxID=1073415 RepID=A0ABV2E658_9STAP|nr:DUF1002 domain-containing protein [Salinicoccus halitifaciens]MCD2137049.1 DUF1002 domain-containing protein [Salinicoccus halitifaciens]